MRRASAFKQEDKQRVMAAVEASPGGAAELNKAVTALLRRALADRGLSALEWLPSYERGTSQLLFNMARLLGAHGRHGEAEVLCREAAEGRCEELGADHSETLMAVDLLALLRGAQGKGVPD